MTHIEVAGRSVAYTDEGAGPAVVLLHGLLMDRSIWDAQIQALRDRYRILAFDAPGHGDSDPVPVGYTFDDLAGAVWNALDSIGVDDPVFGGQSMGGWTSMLCALARPGSARGVIFIDTSAQAENPDTLAQYEAFLQVALDEGVGEDLANILLVILFSDTFASKPIADPWRKKLLEADPARFHAMARAVFDRPDRTHLLQKLTVPALVIHGEQDVAIPMDRAEQIAHALSAPLHRIPGAGHASPFERPELVTPLIAGFLDGLGG